MKTKYYKVHSGIMGNVEEAYQKLIKRKTITEKRIHAHNVMHNAYKPLLEDLHGIIEKLDPRNGICVMFDKVYLRPYIAICDIANIDIVDDDLLKEIIRIADPYDIHSVIFNRELDVIHIFFSE